MKITERKSQMQNMSDRVLIRITTDSGLGLRVKWFNIDLSPLARA